MPQSCFLGDKIGHAKSVGFRLEITSISLIYSLTFAKKKELLFWLARGLDRLTCAARQSRGDSKLRDQPIAPLRPKVFSHLKNSYEIMH